MCNPLLAIRQIQRLVIFSTLVSVALGGGGCSVARHLPAGERLYTGAEVKIEADSLLTKTQIEAAKVGIETLIRPVPNSTLGGRPYRVGLYYLLGEPKKEKSFRGWFRKRFGEAPVLASRRALSANSLAITNYLHNEGFFRASASGELVENRHTAKAIYTVQLPPRYTIQEVRFVGKDSSVFSQQFKKTASISLLKTGNPYQFTTIEAERNRIERVLKREGFYFFRPDYLIVKADTNLHHHQVNLSVELKPDVTQIALKPYTIHEVYVVTDDGQLRGDTLAKAVQRRGLRIVDLNQTYRPRIFADAISFRHGMRYDSRQQDISLTRLVNLKNFKFVKNRFELLPRSDSALLDVYYYLTPLKRKSVRFEVSAVTKSNNLAGSQGNLTWMNRNAFRGAEMLRFAASAGLDVQIGGQRNTNINDFYRTNVEGELSFPRFVLPFYRMNPATNQTLPRTALTVGYEELTRRELYTQTSFRLNWGYVWRRNVEVEHTLTPVAVNIIRPRNINGEAFLNLLTDPFTKAQDLVRYFKILETPLILGMNYNLSFTPTPAAGSRHRWVVTAGIDAAGNLAGLLTKREEVNTDVFARKVFNTVFEQYGRFDGDLRYYYDVSPKIRWANRFLVGLGIPYGNSMALPQFKQYFAGGSNGIRAFRARSLGPGGYAPDSVTLSTFGYNSFGDVRLELNSELRLKLNQYLEMGFFVDAGNVWLYRNFEESGFVPEDNAFFDKDFYQQTAVGAGAGFRFTLPFVLLRIDLAMPFRKPWLPEGQRWVLNQTQFGSAAWRRDNLILNIAVGYSF
jgi:outer membrane protein assembly factor BamA